MTSIDSLFPGSAWRPLVIALLYTLWQGGILLLLVAAVLRRFPACRSSARYGITLAGQFGLFAAWLITWSILEHQSAGPMARSGSLPGTPAATRRDAPEIVAENVATRIGFPGPAAVPGASKGPDWVSIVAAAWLIGSGVMLLRGASSIVAAGNLIKHSRPVGVEVLGLVEELRCRIGLSRRVRVLESPENLGPATFGLFRPILVLPIGLATGLSPELLQAILAHELAHIRRYDYLVNLAQMFVEAILFFNPAAWWLGRQARKEREACCDAWAIQLTVRSFDYARLLASWAEHPGIPRRMSSIAMGWQGDENSSPLRDRILRVLNPAESPQMRVTWTALIALLIIGPIILLLLHRGTSTAVNAVARILTPAERIERLQATQKEYSQKIDYGEGEATIQGTFRTPDGKPLSEPIQAHSISKTGRSATMSYAGLLKDHFSINVPAGRVWLIVYPTDFAPAAVGPYDARLGSVIGDVEIELEAGFPTKVRVVDELGKPVSNAEVSAMVAVENGAVGPGLPVKTDRDGFALIEHATRRRYLIGVKAPGCQSFSGQEVVFSPEATVIVNVVRARPTHGTIVDPTGKPVAGVRIRPVHKKTENNGSYRYSETEAVIGTTDGDGKFTLDTLDDRATYTVLLESDSQGRGLIAGVTAGMTGLHWSLGPNRTLRGTIRGDLNLLQQDRGKPAVHVTEFGPPGQNLGGADQGKFVTVERVGNEGRFSLAGIIEGGVIVRAGPHRHELDVKDSTTSVTIDLTKDDLKPTRRVEIKILTPDGGTEPMGTIRVFDSSPNLDRGIDRMDKTLSLQNGEVSFESRVPNQISYQPVSVLGYWFKSDYFQVPPAPEPLRIEVKGVPAAGIVGRVLEPDGKPATGGIDVSCRGVGKVPGVAYEPFSVNDIVVDDRGRFFLSPLPIGGTYVVVAGRGYNKQVSPPVHLDGSQAVVTSDVRLGRAAAAEGRVIGPDGMPAAAIAVTLILKHPQAGTTWSPPVLTDREGRFRFEGLGTELGGYFAKLDARREFQPIEAALNPGGQPVEIRLERGHVFRGRVIDTRTGWPIPGVELYAHPEPWDSHKHPSWFDAEATTDEAGQFRFSNLPKGRFVLRDRSGLMWNPSPVSRQFDADQVEPFEVRASLPDWSKLKPMTPGGQH